MPNPRYHLEIECLPSTAGTVASRLKRALKRLAWDRLRVRRVQEVAEPTPHLRQEGRSDAKPSDTSPTP